MVCVCPSLASFGFRTLVGSFVPDLFIVVSVNSSLIRCYNRVPCERRVCLLRIWNPFSRSLPLQDLRYGSQGHTDSHRVKTLSARNLCLVQWCSASTLAPAMFRVRVSSVGTKALAQRPCTQNLKFTFFSPGTKALRRAEQFNRNLVAVRFSKLCA